MLLKYSTHKNGWNFPTLFSSVYCRQIYMTNLHKSWKMFQKQLKLCSPHATSERASEQVPSTKWGTIMEINYQTDSDTRNNTSKKLLMGSHQNIHLFAELKCWGRVMKAFTNRRLAVCRRSQLGGKRLSNKDSILGRAWVAAFGFPRNSFVALLCVIQQEVETRARLTSQIVEKIP